MFLQCNLEVAAVREVHEAGEALARPGVGRDGVGDELNFADAAAAELDVALQLATLDHFVFDARLYCGDFPEGPLAERARVAERLDHLKELGGDGGVAGHTAGLDEHHALPGL